ncbi:MAG: hypothetical protein H6909_01590 [Rickettsiaceae bacterium]|nr:hypothetical protein [Rickettsiaceae bacterium]
MRTTYQTKSLRTNIKSLVTHYLPEEEKQNSQEKLQNSTSLQDDVKILEAMKPLISNQSKQFECGVYIKNATTRNNDFNQKIASL